MEHKITLVIGIIQRGSPYDTYREFAVPGSTAYQVIWKGLAADLCHAPLHEGNYGKSSEERLWYIADMCNAVALGRLKTEEEKLCRVEVRDAFNNGDS